jgi:hypothetical protein
MDQDKLIEHALNELISEALKNGGHLYIVDKKRNNFALRLTDPITIHFYGGYKEANND